MGVTFVIVTLAGKEKLVAMISTNAFILVHRNDFVIFRFSSKPSGEFRVGSISDWVNFGSGQFRVGSATSWVSLGLGQLWVGFGDQTLVRKSGLFSVKSIKALSKWWNVCK